MSIFPNADSCGAGAYIVRANREEHIMSGMDTIAAFDQVIHPTSLSDKNRIATLDENGATRSRRTICKEPHLISIV